MTHDVILPIITSFFGFAFGGIITFLTSMLLEERKLKRDLKIKKLEEKREALGQILEFIHPLKNSTSMVELLFHEYFNDEITFQQLIDKYPKVLIDIDRLDPPVRLKAMVPQIYSMGLKIARMIEEILLETTEFRMNNLLNCDRSEYISHVLGLIEAIKKENTTFEQMLISEYNKTFD